MKRPSSARELVVGALYVLAFLLGGIPALFLIAMFVFSAWAPPRY